jgi:glycine dehydrogenase
MLRYLRRLADQPTLRWIAVDDPARLLHDEAQRDGEMVPITWPEFAHIHPFAPADQLASDTRQLNERSATGSPG